MIDFSNWLWKQEVDEIPTELSRRFEWLYDIVLEYKKEKAIYVFDVETTKDLLWYFDKAKEND